MWLFPFSVDCDDFTVDDILHIHIYFLNKNNV